MNRRIPALVLVGAALIAAVVWGRGRVEPTIPTFAAADIGWMPAAPAPGALTESWFCPGAPAAGDGEEARVEVVNRTADPLTGTATVVNDAGQQVEVAVNVAGWARQTIDLDQTAPGAVVSTFVEIDGGGAVVEQYSSLPDGNSALVCATESSSQWYLADGYTVGASSDRIVISNPYAHDAVATVVYSVDNGFVETQMFSGIRVPAQGVRMIELATPGSGAQGEPRIGVSVTATRGRVVVGRIQKFTDDRAGAQVTLASPETRDQWWFPGTARSADTTQEFSIYNPTGDDVQADLIVLGSTVQPDPVDVPARAVVSFDLASLTDLVDGVYTIVVSTIDGQALVVERVTTTTSDGRTGTSVQLGAPPRQDGFIATSWIAGAAPTDPTTGALVIHNADLAEGAFTVYAITASGPVPLPELENVPLAAGASVLIDLSTDAALGQQVVVSSTTRVFVERSLPSGRGSLRTTTWAVPVLPLDPVAGS